MDVLSPVIANALRGRALDLTSRSLGLECLKLMGDRLLLKGRDAVGEIDPECALPLGAIERAALWQAARWINEGSTAANPARCRTHWPSFTAWHAPAACRSTWLRFLRRR